MKRKILLILTVMAFLALLSPRAQAIETDTLDTDKLKSYLDEDVAEKVGDAEDYADGSADIWQILWDVFSENARNLRSPVKCLALITAGAVVMSCLSSFETDNILLQMGVLFAAAVPAVQGITELIESLAAVCRGVSVFLLGAIPVYAGLLITSGNPAAGTSYGTVTLVLANLISYVASEIIIPAMSVLLGLGVAGTFSSYRVSGIIESVYKPIKWLLTFAVTAFSGLISLQTFVSTKIGAAGIKTAKQLVSSAIPVVGSALGDGVEAVRQSMALLRTGAGAFGLVAEVVIFAPLFISGTLWFLCFSLSSVVCEIFGAGKLKSFTDSCLLIVKMILAAAVSVFVVSVVTAAVVVCTGD